MPGITSPSSADPLIPPIRHASRQLVREWGFLRPTLAGTALSAPAVHCLLEIGDHGVRAAPDLCRVLAVGPADLARTLRELISTGNVAAEDTGDAGGEGSESFFSVTELGRETLVAVNASAAAQVRKALVGAGPGAGDRIAEGLRLYAEALYAERLQPSVGGSEARSAGASSAVAAGTSIPDVKIVQGYVPGVLGRTVELHMNYYYRTHSWGQTFEAELSNGLTDLLKRLDKPMNEVWVAVETLRPVGGERSSSQERIVGTIWLDGEIREEPGHGRVRAFIVDEHIRGAGVGRKLFRALMEYVDEIGLQNVNLTTMRSLTSARRLYEEAGFEVMGESQAVRWGQNILQMAYEWQRKEREAYAES
ncbi:hypothetical protein NKR23_g163 [Pleurostoma richardsiae]|uniref:N-acetyltransferase domain-containing protein n=1 Tax=Pleurostoma richardsiae TaxID=41990 RepID=A0AA38S7G7_9PEZI|nr:hypothetical protein NKR23_g163 [Pleurostoma richardsiae]